MKNILPLFPLLALFFPSPSLAQDISTTSPSLIEEGDRHWDLRAEGAQGSHANAKEIDEAIALYRQAKTQTPDSLAVQWRLMRAIFFKGAYGTDERALKKTIFDDGKEIGEEALDLIRKEASRRTGRAMDQAGPLELGPVLSDSPDVIAAFLWSSANWGEWAIAYGKLQAVRQGAASKIRELALAVSRMDPNYAEGGGYRVLGRLYHQTPYVPFITGWASTKDAVGFLRQALQIGPRNSLNRLFLAEALMDLGRDSRREAREVAEALVRDEPRPEFWVEDMAARDRAQKLIERLGNNS